MHVFQIFSEFLRNLPKWTRKNWLACFRHPLLHVKLTTLTFLAIQNTTHACISPLENFFLKCQKTSDCLRPIQSSIPQKTLGPRQTVDSTPHWPVLVCITTGCFTAKDLQMVAPSTLRYGRTNLLLGGDEMDVSSLTQTLKVNQSKVRSARAQNDGNPPSQREP